MNDQESGTNVSWMCAYMCFEIKEMEQVVWTKWMWECLCDRDREKRENWEQFQNWRNISMIQQFNWIFVVCFFPHEETFSNRLNFSLFLALCRRHEIVFMFKPKKDGKNIRFDKLNSLIRCKMVRCIHCSCLLSLFASFCSCCFCLQQHESKQKWSTASITMGQIVCVCAYTAAI